MKTKAGLFWIGLDTYWTQFDGFRYFEAVKEVFKWSSPLLAAGSFIKVSYSENFTVAKSGAQFKVKLNKWKGILAEVDVNGKRAGVIAYPPYELNISQFINNGKNEISVKVIGSLKNTFGYFYKINNRSMNGPGDWNTSPAKLPGIGQYFLMDYGLEEPFTLIRLN